MIGKRDKQGKEYFEPGLAIDFGENIANGVVDDGDIGDRKMTVDSLGGETGGGAVADDELVAGSYVEIAGGEEWTEQMKSR